MRGTEERALEGGRRRYTLLSLLMKFAAKFLKQISVAQNGGRPPTSMKDVRGFYDQGLFYRTSLGTFECISGLAQMVIMAYLKFYSSHRPPEGKSHPQQN